MTQLKDAVVLITGAAGGFGQELTRQLLRAESRLILTDLDAVMLERRSTTIQLDIATGEVLAYLEADLSTAEGCDWLYKQIQALNGSNLLMEVARRLISLSVPPDFMSPIPFCRLLSSGLKERSSKAMAVAF